MEAAGPLGALEELQAALARSEQARLAAEARAAALQAGQAQSARELASLQSLFRQAVEENRGLLEQLAASRARVTALEAAAAVSAHPPCSVPLPLPPVLPPPQQQQQDQLLQQERYPAIYARPASMQAADGAVAAPQAAPASIADQLSRAKRALADQLGDSLPQAQQQQQQPHPPALSEPHHTTISLPASAGPPANLPIEQQDLASNTLPAQPQPAAAASPPAPPGDLHRVFSELQALQRRLQAAEERLQQQAGGQLPADQTVEQQQHAWPRSNGHGGGSRPASPGVAARRPASPARQKEQEHRDSYQLIRELKQRRARLEAERLAAAAAALAAGAPLRGDGACSPPPAGPPASRVAPWLFDTRDLLPGAELHQPLPRQAVSGRAAGGAGSWAQQAALRGRGAAGQAGGSRSSGTSPMAWHAATGMLPLVGNQQLPGMAGDSSRGRRRSLSAEPRRAVSRDVREPLQLSNRRRSTSRSRSEREELDRLLMAGRPTTLLAAGGKAAAAGSAVRSGGMQRGKAGRGDGGSWVSPLVLA